MTNDPTTAQPPQNGPEKPKRKRHRPWNDQRLKLNDETEQAICDALKTGLFRAQAAAKGGITEKTFYNWMDKGEKDPGSRYGRFVRAVTEAELYVETTATAAWMARFRFDWRSAKDYLARRFRDRWGGADEYAIPPGLMQFIGAIYAHAFDVANLHDTPEERAATYLAEVERGLGQGDPAWRLTGPEDHAQNLAPDMEYELPPDRWSEVSPDEPSVPEIPL